MYLYQIILDTKKSTLALANPNLIHAAIETADKKNDYADGQRSRKLWRIDCSDRCHVLLVLSDHLIDLSGVAEQFGTGEYQTKKLDKLLDNIKIGQKYRFRLTANPSYRVAVANKQVAHCTFMQKLQWLISRSEKNGFELDLNTLDITSDHFCGFQKRYVGSSEKVLKNPVKEPHDTYQVSFTQTTFEGTLVVSDAERFKKTLICGIGREKAYGCGMLSIASVK